jgi:hypothetical protein
LYPAISVSVLGSQEKLATPTSAAIAGRCIGPKKILAETKKYMSSKFFLKI